MAPPTVAVPTRPRTTTSAGSVDARHDRVEALLERLESCRSDAERRAIVDDVIAQTIDLADSVARRYRGRGIETDDLLQVARLALVKAAVGYRAGAGSNFAAYAVPTMNGEIKRHFRDAGWAVRPSRRLQEARARLGEARERFIQRHRRMPSAADLAEDLDMSVSEVREAEQCSAAYRAVSLDVPASAEAAAPAEALEAGTDEAESVVQRVALREAIRRLPPRQRRLLHLSFVEERTQSDIGRSLGLSQMQVSRLLRATIQRLRSDLVEQAGAA